MNYLRTWFFFAISLLFSTSLFSQEIIYGLQGVPELQKKSPAYSLKSTQALPPEDTISLPFFDDFSFSKVYPSDSLWRDSWAYVNSHLPVLPPSFNVATLDAADRNGAIYDNLGSQPKIADSLTSAPIDLSLSPDSNIYFSFQYQPGGFGDAPEPGDSLVLEFYAPAEQAWHHVWSVPGAVQQPFQSVILPVDDTIFLKEGFRFRFSNYASLTASSDPGRNSNADFWHIDYVYLNKGRTPGDTVFNDASIVYPPESALEKYTSLPYDHYIASFTKAWTGVIELIIRNNGDQLSNVLLNFEVEDMNTGNSSTFTRGSENLDPFSTDTILNLYEDALNTTEEDSAEFAITAKLGTDALEFRKINDNITFYQYFYDYYAYDDGSPENGYGISGQGAEGAFGAMQFETFKKDTLTGVKILFNPTLNDESEAFFGIGVWADNDGVPGDLIYMEKGFKVDYGDSLYSFATYHLDTSIVLDGLYYVGWQQVTNTYLNFGLDRNTQNNSRYLFYNFDGTWNTSSVSGTVMIRPLFGEQKLSANIPNSPSMKNRTFEVYPNPASHQITLSLPPYITEAKVMLYNTSGQLMISRMQTEPGSFDVTDLKEGVYFIKVVSGQEIFTSRLLIAR